MKVSSRDIYSRAYAVPSLKFEQQELTSFAGLVIFQRLFQKLGLAESLNKCFRHLRGEKSYKHGSIVQILVVHLLLGFRKFEEIDFYRDDPIVQQIVGMKSLPSTSTISRYLREVDEKGEKKLQELTTSLVEERIKTEKLSRITLGFDGSVIDTKGHAEGTAVGFNPNKKGSRSYYPNMCTLAQTGQVLAVLHRSGNVHDSNKAREFVHSCVERVQKAVPRAVVEVRLDGAFFSEKMVEMLEAIGVQYTISVPFERFTDLKEKIQTRKRWWPVLGEAQKEGYFEQAWKPKSWSSKQRFLFVRQASRKQQKGPVQLDLFEPRNTEWEYKVVLTNKTNSAKKVLRFHEGRGNDEGIYAELKSQLALGYIPGRKWVTNRLFLVSNLLAHNLSRELQMSVDCRARATNEKRSPYWVFEGVQTMRRKFLHRAGRFVRPDGRLTLSIKKNKAVEKAIKHYWNIFQVAN